MTKDSLGFLKAIFLFSLIVAAAAYVCFITFLGDKVNHITWIIFFYFIIITVAFHLGLLNSSKGKPQGFVRYYMGATTLKLFIHLITLLLYCLFNREEAVRFIVTFLIYYLVYTGFEVAVAMKKFRKN
ncbi:MAG: hypothetical protein NT126_02990 [Bacteroidetes bacterium]|nr:hypothetical protein [Bacteroidota bacterium]